MFAHSVLGFPGSVLSGGDFNVDMWRAGSCASPCAERCARSFLHSFLRSFRPLDPPRALAKQQTDRQWLFPCNAQRKLCSQNSFVKTDHQECPGSEPDSESYDPSTNCPCEGTHHAQTRTETAATGLCSFLVVCVCTSREKISLHHKNGGAIFGFVFLTTCLRNMLRLRCRNTGTFKQPNHNNKKQCSRQLQCEVPLRGFMLGPCNLQIWVP